jgi:hypothetical protein
MNVLSGEVNSVAGDASDHPSTMRPTSNRADARFLATLFQSVGGLFRAQRRCTPITVGRAGRRQESNHHRASDQKAHELELGPKMMGAQHIFSRCDRRNLVTMNDEFMAWGRRNHELPDDASTHLATTVTLVTL